MCSNLLPNLTFPHAVPQSLLILPCTLPLLAWACLWTVLEAWQEFVEWLHKSLLGWSLLFPLIPLDFPPAPSWLVVYEARALAFGLWPCNLLSCLFTACRYSQRFSPSYPLLTLSPSLARFTATRWSNKSSNCPPLEETRPARACAPATTFEWHRSESSLVFYVAVISVHFIRNSTFTASF